MSVQSYEAFKKLDCIVDSYPVKGRVAFEGQVAFDFNKFLEKLLEFLPDILFVLNVNGLDACGGIAEICREKKIEIACWFIDNPFYSYENWRSICGLDNVHFFVWDKYYMPGLRKHHERVYYVPQATDPEKFFPRKLSSQERRSFGNRVAFAGNQGISSLAHVIEDFKKRFQKEKDNVESWFLQASQIAIEQKRTNAREIFKETNVYFEDIKMVFEDKAKFFLAQKILETNIFVIIRTGIIKNLLPLGIKVWGNRDWESSIPPESYMGPALYMRDSVLNAGLRLPGPGTMRTGTICSIYRERMQKKQI